MTGPNIHEVERGELKRRWSLALVLSVAIAMIVATWIGLFGFLGVNAAYATFDRLLDRWLPQIETEPTLLAFPDLSRVSHVYTEDGTLLAELHAGRISEPVRFVDVPETLVNAILAAEDGDYFDHQGVDFTAIASAIRDHITGVDRRGGSTITQQVVKNNIVGDEQTIQRKILEALYAIELEQRHTKQEILQFYMNSVYFGWSAYGVAAAAREYFGKEELTDLTIAESATLAVTIRNPTLYDPRRQPERAEDRRNDVIDAMAAAGDISYEAAAAAKEAPFLIQQPEPFTSPAEHVVAEVRRQILNDREFDEHLGFTNAERRQALFGCPAHEEDCEGGGGLNVYVTVDLDLQSAANRILRSWLPLAEEDSTDTRGAPTGAIAMVENHTGAVLAMSSGLPFEQEQFDLVIQGRRNPGSAFKPFVLVAYLEAGGSLQSYWDARSPLEIECEDPCGPDGGYVWTVRNAGSVDDLLTVAQATERSVNTVYAQLSVLVGPPAIIRTAHKMGITSDLEEVYSLALGAGVVSPLEMASAYSTFATNGVHAEPYLISRITADDGRVIYDRKVRTTQAVDPVLAAAVRRPMERVVCCGTARRADMEGVPQAGKTGTHQAYRDAWFVGYVPNFTTAVWVGYPDEQISLENVVINGETYTRVFGGSVPAPIWKEFMEVALAKYPVGEFPSSLGIGYYNELPFTEVPEVTGMTTSEARDAVLGAHLMAEVEEVLSAESRGTVLGSDPVAGQEVDQGSTVTIRVAGETSALVVPALEGLSSEEALETIQIAQEAAGTAVSIEILYQPADDPELVDRVLLTVPSAGELVATDGALSLVIGR
ncbi:transglycosylase domain-containing protein [Candidatus Spongiisocius sp.]|uniref:transglycosylase domain-containing protein n=1 Tax=Candidatus Spongiisocius sp. TaxID=3101273 RepID=UPI003B59F9E7